MGEILALNAHGFQQASNKPSIWCQINLARITYIRTDLPCQGAKSVVDDRAPDITFPPLFDLPRIL